MQNEIKKGHEKALSTLRGCQWCKDRSLKVFQYTFDDRKKLLNLPEELSPTGIDDKVKKLNEDNYYPDSSTALYNVIYEALEVIEKQYLQKARDEGLVDRVIISVITDGEDTFYPEGSYEKDEKINQIKRLMYDLRGGDGQLRCHLYRSVLIGLTSDQFTRDNLRKVKEELTFDEDISLDQSDEISIKKAFKICSETV